MFTKGSKLNEYDKVTLIYEPTVIARAENRKTVNYLIILVAFAFLLLTLVYFDNANCLKKLIHLQPKPELHPKFLATNNIALKNSHGDKCPIVDFDYLQLTVRWPASFCNYHKCKGDVSVLDWDIHGLWPDYKNGSFPQFCCNSYHFDKQELDNLIPILKKKWPNLIKGQQEDSLWKHEWDKHGTCTKINKKLGTIHNYFEQSLNLFDTYNVQKWFEEENILPNSKKAYKLQDLQNVFLKKMGKNVKFECDVLRKVKQNCADAVIINGEQKGCKTIKAGEYRLLDSIDICFDKMSLTPIDCPESKRHRRGNCLDEVYYIRNKDGIEDISL